ncbi:MAG: diguanylate cyclase [Sphingomonas fennica]
MRRSFGLERLIAPIAVALIYYAGAIFAFTAARSADGSALVWACTGFLVGVMLWLPAATRWRVVPGAMAASLIGNLQAGYPVSSAILFTAANLGEVWLALTLIGRLCGARLDLTELRHLYRFCAVALVTAAAGAGVTLAVSSEQRDWLLWFATDALGMLVVTPFTLFALQAASLPRPWIVRRHAAEVAASLTALCALTILCFAQNRFPLLFLPLAALSFLTYRGGLLGATLGMAVIAGVTAAATAMGLGPIPRTASDDILPVLFCQFYIAACFVATMPMAAHAAAARRQARHLVDSERFHRRVVDRATGVLFATDGRGRWTFLNPAWETVTGRSIEDSLGVPALHLIDRRDWRRAVRAVRPLLAGEIQDAEFEARAALGSGDSVWLHVAVRLNPDQGEGAGGTFGLIRDVTDRVRAEQALAESERRYRLLAEDAQRAAAEARVQADTDELTGLANRRHFLRRLEREVRHAADGGRPLSLAIFDVDHFKRVNDAYGHLAGDDMLRHIAEAAGRALRSGDLLARVGGEEFALLMPGAETAHAIAVAARVRAAVADRPAALDHLPTVTVSVGLAAFAPGLSPLRLLAQADTALYQAKRTGRDRLCVAEAPAGEH